MFSNILFQNKYGLVYADLDLAPGPSGSRFVIRGIEKRNNYAIIDLTKTAEPIKVITKLPNFEQSYKGKVKTHNYINRQNQSTTGKL